MILCSKNALTATSLAALIISYGDWRQALAFDALTFLVFGFAILIYGRDPDAEVNNEPADENKISNIAYKKVPGLREILAITPLLYGTNALIWNYLPLIADRFSVLPTSQTLLLLSVLRIPGMLGSIYFEKLAKLTSLRRLVQFIPCVYLMLSVFFAIRPALPTLVALILSQGLLVGVYWPADLSIRNQLSNTQLITFNTVAVRRLACFQFVSCCFALIVFSPAVNGFNWIPAAVIAMAVTSIGLSMSWRFSQ